MAGNDVTRDNELYRLHVSLLHIWFSHKLRHDSAVYVEYTSLCQPHN